MLKKLFTITSILLLAINVCVFAEKADNDYERLLNLGIIDDSYANYANRKTVSQKDFLEALVNIATEDSVDEDNVAEYAKSLGIISTINTAELNSAIKYERALNLSLNLMGYSKIIEISGNDTQAVIKLANDSKLTSGITLSVGDTLNGKSFIKLLNNIIEANVINADVGKSGGNGYSVSDETALYSYREIEKIKGKVTRVQDTSLLYENGCGNGKIAIDEEIFSIDYDYSQELLGQNVYVYVKEKNGNAKAYYVEPVNSDTNRIEISDKDILNVASDFSQISYENGTRTKTLKLNPALIVIYNGQNYAGYTVADLMPKCGKLVCMDTDGDNKYDIVYVYSYDTVVVKNVSQSYRTVSNLYSVPAGINILDLSDTSIDVRIYCDGKEAAFSSILANNVLSVAQSKGNDKIVTIYVSKETVSGEFSAVDDSEKTAVIREIEYRINDAYYDAIAAGDPIDTISFGSVYTCYLDAFGAIAFVKRDERDGYEYAYLLTQRWKIREDTAKVRLLNSDGDWEDVYYAKKVKLNSDNRQDAQIVYNSLGQDTITPQLIMIKRDEDGRIKAIKTAVVSSIYNPNSFTLAQATEFEKYYWSQDSSFNCRHYVKYDAAVFIKPSNAADILNEEKYAVVSAGFFGGDRSYKYLAYNVDEFGFPDAFVVSASTPGAETTIYVNKMITMLNGDGEAVRAVVGNLEGLENMTVQISPNFTDAISVGDIIEVALKDAVIINWNNDAESYSNLKTKDAVTGIGWARQYHLADATSPARPKDAPADDRNIHSNYRFFRGNIKSVNTERRILLLDCGTSGTVPVYVRGGANINIYNSDTKKYELRELSDIPPTGYAIVRMNGNNVTSVGVYD